MPTPELRELADALAECRRVLLGARELPASEVVRLECELEEIERRLREAAEQPVPRAPRRARRRAVSAGNRLRVAVGLRQFSSTIGGTAIYTQNVLAGLARDHGARLTIYAVESEVQTLRESVPEAQFRSAPDHSAGLSIEQVLDQDAHDVLFCPLYLLDPPRPALPAAVTIHGLGDDLHPENFDPRILELRRRAWRSSALTADTVFTVSETSKNAIAAHYEIDPAKIVIAPPGVSPVFAAPAPLEPSATLRALRLPGDYLYYPANFWAPKNHVNLLKAFRILVEGPYPELGLVLSGEPGPDADRVSALAHELGVHDHVRMLGYVDQSVVCDLARHARAVTYLSQHEGFAIPIIEAFNVGAPVVTTFAEACQETAGDAALYAAYDDPIAIASEIERLLNDPQLARELSVRGRRRATAFSWEAAVATIAEELERLAHTPRVATTQAPMVG